MKKKIIWIAGFYLCVIVSMFLFYRNNKKNIENLDLAAVGVSGEFIEESSIEEEETEAETEIETQAGQEIETEQETEIEAETEMETKPVEKTYVFISTNKRSVLYVRSAPSMSGKIIGRLAPASEGEVLEQGEYWSLIRNGAVEGYSNNWYLDIREKEESH